MFIKKLTKTNEIILKEIALWFYDLEWENQEAIFKDHRDLIIKEREVLDDDVWYVFYLNEKKILKADLDNLENLLGDVIDASGEYYYNIVMNDKKENELVIIGAYTRDHSKYTKTVEELYKQLYKNE